MVNSVLQVTTKRPGGIGFAADAWGLACTILELASGAPPFSGQAGVNKAMDILNILMNVRPPSWPVKLCFMNSR
jgi:hypothetical protein